MLLLCLSFTMRVWFCMPTRSIRTPIQTTDHFSTAWSMGSIKHMVPSPATIAARARVRAAQGVGNVYFVGGFTYPYDSQETALLSALAVADALAVPSERRSGLS